MKSSTIITLSHAFGLFNFEGASGALIANVISLKSNIDSLVESINKKRKEAHESAKPGALEPLKQQLKDQLNATVPDDKKIMVLQASINILQQEWQEKSEQADRDILDTQIEFEGGIKKLSFADFELLKKERKELVQLDEGRRQVVTTNQFTTDHLMALSAIIDLPKQ